MQAAAGVRADGLHAARLGRHHHVGFHRRRHRLCRQSDRSCFQVLCTKHDNLDWLQPEPGDPGASGGHPGLLQRHRQLHARRRLFHPMIKSICEIFTLVLSSVRSLL